MSGVHTVLTRNFLFSAEDKFLPTGPCSNSLVLFCMRLIIISVSCVRKKFFNPHINHIQCHSFEAKHKPPTSRLINAHIEANLEIVINYSMQSVHPSRKTASSLNINWAI
jgi:hypothetical protein